MLTLRLIHLQREGGRREGEKADENDCRRQELVIVVLLIRCLYCARSTCRHVH
jgi:hypothetical protein